MHDFVVSLRQQAAFCDFGAKHDKMIHVMLGARATDPKIRAALLQEAEEISLDKVIDN